MNANHLTLAAVAALAAAGAARRRGSLSPPGVGNPPDFDFWPTCEELLEGTSTLHAFMMNFDDTSIKEWLWGFRRQGEEDRGSPYPEFPFNELPLAFYLSGLEQTRPPDLNPVIAWRYGNLPGEAGVSEWSTNYVTGEREGGVSVVQAWSEDAWKRGAPPTKQAQHSPVFFMNRPQCWFFGFLSGSRGSDGEPLIIEASPLSMWSQT